MARLKKTGNLKIENFQVIKQIDLDITKSLIVIGGKNGQGKTSVLRAIHACIVGKSACKDKEGVVRDGEKEGEVILSLGDVEITRRFDENDRWQVSFRRNGRVETSKVQDRLDTLVSKTTFDPSFLWDSKVTEKDRAKLFLDAIGVDVSDLDSKRVEAYEARTDAGREIKRLTGWLDTHPLEMDAPDEPVDVGVLNGELAKANNANRDKMKALSLVENNWQRYNTLKAELASVRERIKQLQIKEQEILTEGKALRNETETLETQAEQMPEVDTDAITERIRDAYALNTAYQASIERKAAGELLTKAEAEQVRLTGEITRIDSEKAHRLSTAKLPLEGLEANSEGLYLHGHPISRASGRERLTVALSVAIANADPDLPLVCCDGGEQFDPEWLPHIESMAEDAGVVIILTRVGTDPTCTVIMEDGQILSESQYLMEPSLAHVIEDTPSVLVDTNSFAVAFAQREAMEEELGSKETEEL